MILHMNEYSYNPLEFIFRKNIEKTVKREAKDLVKYIL